jgi:hypothetical protein
MEWDETGLPALRSIRQDRPAQEVSMPITLRDSCRCGVVGLHWDALDEDISIEGLLAGRGDQTKRRQQVA